jgi:20S proteasome alpha/beta subunit
VTFNTFNTLLTSSCKSADWRSDAVIALCISPYPSLTSSRLQEFSEADSHTLTPPQLYRSLSRMMYNRRTKVDPLWNSLVLAGIDPTTGTPFLGYVDLLGTTYQSSTIATGFGLHLAQPLLRKAVEGREHLIEEAEATDILENCMKVLCKYLTRAV